MFSNSSDTALQACKYDTTAQPELLQPLPILKEVWIDISIDSLEGYDSQKRRSHLGCCGQIEKICSFHSTVPPTQMKM